MYYTKYNILTRLLITNHHARIPIHKKLSIRILQANLALTNNAKGLIWFAYVGDNKVFGSNDYNVGIMNNVNGVPAKRDSNVYVQNKYLKVCQIDSMLERREPYIMSFETAFDYKNCFV